MEQTLRFLGCGLLLFVPYFILTYTFPVHTQFLRPYTTHLVVASVALGAVAATFWTRKQQQIRSERVYYLLQAIIRYCLAYVFVVYAVAKFFRTQFYEPLLLWQDTPAGRLSGFELTWTFFGSSYAYAIFIGVSQLVPAILLLFRKTQLTGALLLIPVVANIIFINFAYDIPVKLNSCVFLIMATYLALPEFGRLKAFFWDNKPVEPRRDPVLEPKAQRLAYAGKWSCMVLIFGITLWRFGSTRASTPYVERPITGIWEVATFEENGEVLYARQQPAGRNVWTKVIFEPQFGGTRAYLKSGDEVMRAAFGIDPEGRRLEIRGPGVSFTGQYELVNESHLVISGARGDDSLRIELQRAP